MTLIDDMVRQAEIDRAAAEGRKPDFENPAGIAGVVTTQPPDEVVTSGDDFMVKHANDQAMKTDGPQYNPTEVEVFAEEAPVAEEVKAKK